MRHMLKALNYKSKQDLIMQRKKVKPTCGGSDNLKQRPGGIENGSAIGGLGGSSGCAS